MSKSIGTSFVQMYGKKVRLLSQQTGKKYGKKKVQYKQSRPRNKSKV